MRFSTRVRFCRWAFLLACLLPTIVVGGIAMVIHTPVYSTARARIWQNQLSAQLGLDVRFSHVTRDRDNRLIVRGVQVCDPESHEWLARARSAEIGFADQGMVIVLGQPEIAFIRLPRLVEVLHEHLLRRSVDTTQPIQITASSLVLRHDDRSQTLLDLCGKLDQVARDPEVLVRFRCANAAIEDWVRLRIARNRQVVPPATAWELHTPPSGLPCSTAIAWLPALEQLGRECVFQGSIWAEPRSRGWNAEISGLLSHVDLDQLVTGQFPHKLSGSAELTLAPLTIENGKTTRAEGTLTSNGGVVSRSILEAAEQSLGLTRHARPDDMPLLRYRQLSLNFALDTTSLTVNANPERSDMIVMADNQGPLLSLAEEKRGSPLSLVHLLVPETDLHVPATKETAALFRTLPLPATPRSPSAASRDGYRPVRLIRE